MPDGSQVSDFNVTSISTNLRSTAIGPNSSVLEPYWDVKLYLNQTYPGSVHGLEVRLWAGCGEFCKQRNYDFKTQAFGFTCKQNLKNSINR
jgi:hypothetical protein